ncbi:MAG: hypothetical protein ACJ76R_09840 [Solirubrobacteraceae bacterium]
MAEITRPTALGLANAAALLARLAVMAIAAQYRAIRRPPAT